MPITGEPLFDRYKKVATPAVSLGITTRSGWNFK